MSALDRAVLAERAMAVERHLRRVADRLPATAAELQPSTDTSDAVILHLWQATQIVIDLAMSTCLRQFIGALRGLAVSTDTQSERAPAGEE